MKNLRITSTIALAAVLGASLAAAAQTPPPGQGQGQGRTPIQPGAAATEPNRPAAPQDAQTRKLTVQRLDRLGGTKIKTLQGEEIGQLEDIVVGANGEALYGVVSFAKIEGMGDKWYLMPWSSVKYRGPDGVGVSGDGSIVLGIAKERLKNAPGFDKHSWPSKKSGEDVAQTEWPFGDVDKFYEPETRATGRPINASARTNASGILRASEIRGRSIETANGEKLGSVSDIVVDPMNGRVNYVVISTAGQGAGDRLIAVPFEALRSGKAGAGANDPLILPFTRDRLSSAPEFQRGDAKWAEMSDPVYVQRVYDFYAVRPYWTAASDVNRPAGTQPKDAVPPKTPPKTPPQKDEPPKRG